MNTKAKLDIRSGYSSPVTIHCSYGDSGTTVTFYIYNEGEDVDLDGAVVTVHGTRKDGANFGPFNATASGNQVTFTIKPEMTAVEGGAIAELSISKGGANFGTANFALLVENAAFPNGVSYSTDPSVYQDILKYVMSIESVSKSEIDVQKKRIDNYLSSGTAATDSELVDIRVGADGKTYTSAGTAVRTQLNHANKVVADHTDPDISLSIGTFNDNDPFTNVSNTARVRTEEIIAWDSIYGIRIPRGYQCYFAKIDENLSFISGKGWTTPNNGIVVFGKGGSTYIDSKYVRCSFKKSDGTDISADDFALFKECFEVLTEPVDHMTYITNGEYSAYRFPFKALANKKYAISIHNLNSSSTYAKAIVVAQIEYIASSNSWGTQASGTALRLASIYPEDAAIGTSHSDDEFKWISIYPESGSDVIPSDIQIDIRPLDLTDDQVIPSERDIFYPAFMTGFTMSSGYVTSTPYPNARAIMNGFFETPDYIKLNFDSSRFKLWIYTYDLPYKSSHVSTIQANQPGLYKTIGKYCRLLIEGLNNSDITDIVGNNPVSVTKVGDSADNTSYKYSAFLDKYLPYTKHVNATARSWDANINVMHISDSHIATTGAAGNLIDAIDRANDLGIIANLALVVNTGDHTNGGTITKSNIISQANTFTSISLESNVPVLQCIGNHDSNDATTDDPSDLTKFLTQDEMYQYYAAPFFNKYASIQHPTNKRYSYIDVSSGGYTIRFISLDIADHTDYTTTRTYLCLGTAVYSQDQISWLCNTALNVPANYGVVILNHFPFAPNRNVYTEEHATLSDAGFAQPWNMIPEIVRAWKNRTSINKTYNDSYGSQNIMVSANFSSIPSSAVFCCYLTGHTHSKNDFMVESDNYSSFGQLMLAEDSSGQPGYELNKVFKIQNTVVDNAFSCLSFDMYNKKIYRVAYGAYQHSNAPEMSRIKVFDIPE